MFFFVFPLSPGENYFHLVFEGFEPPSFILIVTNEYCPLDVTSVLDPKGVLYNLLA